MKKIAIIGQGYVGLPLSLSFVECGISVLGVDIDPNKVATLNSGNSYIKHISADQIRKARENDKFRATANFSRLEGVQAILICVPTPLSDNAEPNLSYVLNTGKSIAPYLKKGVLVVLESTTYPGTTEFELKSILESGSGLQAGRDFFLAYSPEREDPGNSQNRTKLIPKLVGGLTPDCLKMASELYAQVAGEVVPVSSCRVAEAAKLLENIFRSVNIALVNELKCIYEAMGIDVWEVIEAAKTKPFGFMPFYPGPGLGGHCIPIDPFYLTWKARQYGQHSRFIELAGEINSRMPDYVTENVTKVLNEEGKSVKGARILLLGLAYKEEVDDDRESPAYAIMDNLVRIGALVYYHDPFFEKIPETRNYSKYAGIPSSEISDDYDIIIVSTGHQVYRDFDFSDYPIPLVDTRNCITKRPAKYYRS